VYRGRVSRLTRADRVVIAVVLALLALGAVGPPLWALGDARYAVADAFVAGAGADPWGRSWRTAVTSMGRLTYSTGPDGVDDGGAGDDVWPYRVARSEAFRLWRHAREVLLGLALAVAWTYLAWRQGGLPRSERLGVEVLRSALVAGPVGAVPVGFTWLAFGEPLAAWVGPWTETLLVPRELAVLATLSALCVLAVHLARVQLYELEGGRSAPGPGATGRGSGTCSRLPSPAPFEIRKAGAQRPR